jgi:transcriptional regulator with XRE-family HTH domain
MRHHGGVTDLAGSLRSWRERLAPEEAGLPAGARRRAPGLRREEVAMLAGVSVGYLTRLEQGRADHPSAQVLTALGRALRLSEEEQAHLLRSAGHADGDGRMRRHLTPGVQRMLDRLVDVPVLVIDAAWDTVAANPLAVALVGEEVTRPGREGNYIWRHFSGGASRVLRSSEEVAAMEESMVADLHAGLGRHPEDPVLRERIAELRRASPRFEELWAEKPTAVHTEARKTFAHPEVGTLTLDCDTLHVHGTDLRLVVHSAAPGTPDAEALALLAVVGLQRF